jgi:hypothetical protein
METCCKNPWRLYVQTTIQPSNFFAKKPSFLIEIKGLKLHPVCSRASSVAILVNKRANSKVLIDCWTVEVSCINKNIKSG